MGLFSKLTTYRRLGLKNIARVGIYRGLLKSGLPAHRLPVLPPVPGPFFLQSDRKISSAIPVNKEWKAYSLYPQPLQDPPHWHQGILAHESFDSTHHWSAINEFTGSDIKDVWEASRFEWIFPFIFQIIQDGDSSQLSRLNSWLEDWSLHNPCNQGVNWKCGQESAIRIMHLVTAALILNQHKSPATALNEFIRRHLVRIRPTMFYAIAQDNNHAISEAAACLIGGWFLERNPATAQFGKNCQAAGRHSLEKLVRRLILPDGTFSQYSVNYHRLMLDVCSYTELIRGAYRQSPFSSKFYEAMRVATQWLYSMTDAESGDAPNSGANDGARLFPLAATTYRDYRPAVQLAAALFWDTRAYTGPGAYDAPHQLFGIIPAGHKTIPLRTKFPSAGYTILYNNIARIIFRHPQFRFRPSHCDVLHVDVWLNHQPILHDDGTFRYNSNKIENIFGGTALHNTVMFDEHEQMPRFSRFLYGEWIQCKTQYFENPCRRQVAAAYTDRFNCSHRREITLEEGAVYIRDTLSGFKQKAVLRWHLSATKNWELKDSSLSADNITLTTVTESADDIHPMLSESVESLYYSQMTPCKVYAVTITKPCVVLTTLRYE